MRSLLLGLSAVLLATAMPTPSAAQAATQSVYLACATEYMVNHEPTPTGNPLALRMESTYFANDPPRQVFGGCWAHYSVYQWFLGTDHELTLKGGKIRIDYTENAMAPSPEALPLIEVSSDGRGWSPVLATVSVPAVGIQVECCELTYDATLVAQDQSFRFLRVHGPLSATGGLGGYIDYAYGTLSFTVGDPAPTLPSATPETTLPLSCLTDIMEAVYPAHPCSYGGVDDYDSTSGLATYFLGDARISKVSGAVTMDIFRKAINGVEADYLLSGTTNVSVQIGVDGVNWTEIGKLHDVSYLQSTPFSFPAPAADTPAKFVRLAAEKHHHFNDYYDDKNGDGKIDRANQQLRRTESYFVLDHVDLDGKFMVASGLPALPVQLPL